MAITQVHGQSHCRSSRASVLEFSISTPTHTQFRMAQNSTSAGPTGMLTSAFVEECPYAARTHSIHSKEFGKGSTFDWDTGHSELSFLVTFLNSSM